MLTSETIGYGIFFAKHSDYGLGGSPKSWSKVVAMRHAMAKFPDCRYLWYLDQDSFVMNPKFKVEEAVMNSKKLEGLMIKDQSVVPPDSIIKTFSHLRGDDVDFVVTQDQEGMSAGSFILRNGEWAQFFVDTWFDPLYRTYNFQKAETHALVRPGAWIWASPEANNGVGTHCPMAPDDPLEARLRAPANDQRVL